eukprot:TRINITY_DN8164_c0_g4_i1.p2 TRINITY_DN8164_c0_g4~~TRINITY_DN8164_c0_g4_i1.p2  ORF type:complete len:136 (+),score=29.03 TRINITY_DN8164_c0_g4_i1:83-490(+)
MGSLRLWLAMAMLSAVCFRTGAEESSGSGCCKICKKGTACGNTCISQDKKCHKTSGCACDSVKCCKFCSDGKPCGDTCISPEKECSKPPGCACGPDTEKGSYDSPWWLDLLKTALKKTDLAEELISTLKEKKFEL